MAVETASVWPTVIQAGAASLSPIIAIVGGWIGWQQLRINRNKLKLDRFDKRYAIYETTMEFLGSLVFHNRVADQDRIHFIEATRGAQFMLSREVAIYLEEVRSKADRFNIVVNALTSTVPAPFAFVFESNQQRDEFKKERVVLAAWFKEQLQEGVNATFAPFLLVKDL